MEAQRFSLVMDAELSDDENNQNKPLTNMLETRLCMSCLSNYEVHTCTNISFSHLQGKFDASEPDIDSKAPENQVVLWLANFEELVCWPRHKVGLTIPLHFYTKTNKGMIFFQ